MASLQKIKSRIHTVESIRKITHAMELVSTSKMRKAREYFNVVTSYHDQVRDVFDKFLANVDSLELQEYTNQHRSAKRLFIVVASDLGLAGAHNSNVIKLAKRTINADDLVILIGSKAISALQNRFSSQLIWMQKWANITPDKLAQQIVKLAMQQYNSNAVGQINIIYDHFVNNLVQNETNEQILPYNINREVKQKDKLRSLIEFEPNVVDVLVNTLPLFVGAKINLAFASAIISEFASRRAAMETATDNADELINNLNLDYNRKRQSNITQELNEIVGGANAV
ncbi:ATP synthase F1 subunit gamma [Mycoplasma simbae]|uniref:ATP synthase F1 subunit gamma n=1 Tax=Mycoplasma simbae TaxID=36744 RepID=UPI0004984429|nr:ATP synthase F1 subunit gamma [Mycoplasma simbae]